MPAAYQASETAEELWPNLPAAPYCIITPYLVPLASPKRLNHGDGFILDACVRLIGYRPSHLLSAWTPFDDQAVMTVNRTACVVLAGANSLKDDFRIVPGFDGATLDRIAVPIVPFGVGHYGVAAATRGFTPASIDVLAEIHRRIRFSSVRCDASQRYLMRGIPDYADRILMTSCPVVHVADGPHRGFARKAIYEQAVVTITDRVDVDAQLPLLGLARTLFRARRWVLAHHQYYANAALDDYAARLGFETFRCGQFRELIDLYAATDLHFGNRLHAHLKCLANGAVSFLCPFDLRQALFSESLDFPLISGPTLGEVVRYDFTRVRRRVSATRPALERFLAALRELIAAAPHASQASLRATA